MGGRGVCAEGSKPPLRPPAAAARSRRAAATPAPRCHPPQPLGAGWARGVAARVAAHRPCQPALSPPPGRPQLAVWAGVFCGSREGATCPARPEGALEACMAGPLRCGQGARREGWSSPAIPRLHTQARAPEPRNIQGVRVGGVAGRDAGRAPSPAWARGAGGGATQAARAPWRASPLSAETVSEAVRSGGVGEKRGGSPRWPPQPPPSAHACPTARCGLFTPALLPPSEPGPPAAYPGARAVRLVRHRHRQRASPAHHVQAPRLALPARRRRRRLGHQQQ